VLSRTDTIGEVSFLAGQHELSSTDPDEAKFVVTVEQVDAVAVVAVAGAVDMLTAPRLAQAIRSALDEKPVALIIDLTVVDFLASAGMQVIVAAHEDAGSDVRLVVAANGPATSRPLRITGIADFIDVFDTRDDALKVVQA
jgi:anti-sigma B factor antagonist